MWSVFVVCECGWWDEPSFGDSWFTRKQYPVCPRCGRDTSEAETARARVRGVFRKKLERLDDVTEGHQ